MAGSQLRRKATWPARWGARLLDAVIDHFLAVLITAIVAAIAGLGGHFWGHFLHVHRDAVVRFLIGVAVGGIASLVAGAIRALQISARRARYLEAQKELIYNALESIQQAVAIDEDWGLDQLVERGVLGPVRGLLQRAEFGDVRLAVLVPDEDRPEDFVMRWAAGHRPEGVRNYKRAIDLTLAGRAYRDHEIFVCQDVEAEPGFQPNPRATRPFRSIVAVPLQINEDVVGVLSVIATEANAFVEMDVSFIRVVGALLDVLLASEFDFARIENEAI